MQEVIQCQLTNPPLFSFSQAFIHPFSTVPPQVQLFHTQFLIKSTALVKSSTTSSSSTTDHEPPTSSSSTSSSQNMVKIPLNSLNDMMDYYLSSSSAHDGTECTAIPYHYVFEMLPDIKASSTGTARLLNTTYYQVCSNGSISSSVSNCFNRSTPSYSEYRIFSHAKKVKKMQRYAVATIIYSTLPILLLLFHQIKTTRNSQPVTYYYREGEWVRDKDITDWDQYFLYIFFF